MRKKSRKYLLLFSVMIFAFCAYQYAKPKVFITREVVVSNIPPKINAYHGESKIVGDSVLLYLPYKFRIENHRFRTIKIGHLHYKQMKGIHANMQTLYFDEGGNPFGDMKFRVDRRDHLDELLGDKKIIDYLKLKNIEIVFPFSSKSVYYYKSYKLSTKIFQNQFSEEEYFQISENFYGKQQTTLFHKQEFPIKKRIIDSLYKEDKKQNLLFNFYKLSKSKYGYSRIKYDLSDEKQTFSEHYVTIKNMNKHELYEFLKKPVYEN